ncbi:polysaccharide biosynthesis protein [Ureibacillus chungkukjangi]|uniref:putative polysaccharide biosynthesis protein n=1 Tax=Ureibacillus chungkukjangi TaxID=1202712 RepID=UPI00203CE851|nr:polysaccharide biosynthesis protein [Ureibacillus chungkukjangi]MCM3387419.1 polysaccharide biosynthesis protein [Ureibacillus chungkukjangi]
MSSLMKGTAILTVGLFLSKVLGLVYVFPFYSIVGKDNVGLYQYAYIPYNIMLSVAISGLPLGVSKFVSKYNSLDDYEAGRKLFKSGILVMIITGIISFIILNLLATPIANVVIKDEEQIYTVDQIASAIRWVSYALLAVPIMSLIRGFFQGYSHYLPTSVSQLIEQIVRIVVLLGGSFVVVILLQGKPETAVKFAVFAAFVGAVGGLVVLYFYWKKLSPEFNLLRENSVSSGELSYKAIYKEIIKYSIPFVFVGMASSLFQLVDMLTFNSAMVSIGLAHVTDDYLTMLNFTTQKIVIIPVMLATGFSMALIPTITKHYTLGAFDTLRSELDKTYQILLFITIPASIGIALLAPGIYHVLYEQSEMGAEVLAHYAPLAILFALFSVTAAILQGIDYQKWIIFSLLTGVLVKLMLNTPLIKMMEVDGALLATAIGYGVTISINIAVIHKALHYRSKLVVRRIILICILTLLMSISVLVVNKLLYSVAVPTNKLLEALYLMLSVGVGMVVYGYLSFRLKLAQKLLGGRITKIANKLGFK